jgi:hypothetical protein
MLFSTHHGGKEITMSNIRLNQIEREILIIRKLDKLEGWIKGIPIKKSFRKDEDFMDIGLDLLDRARDEIWDLISIKGYDETIKEQEE